MATPLRVVVDVVAGGGVEDDGAVELLPPSPRHPPSSSAEVAMIETERVKAKAFK